MGRRESRRDGEDSAERAAARAAGRGPEGCGRDRVGGAAARSELVRLATPRVVQEALEQEQTDFVGRERYARQPGRGKRNGCIPGHLDTAEGRLSVQVPQVREAGTPCRSALDDFLRGHSDVVERLAVEMWARSRSARSPNSEEGAPLNVYRRLGT